MTAEATSAAATSSEWLGPPPCERWAAIYLTVQTLDYALIDAPANFRKSALAQRSGRRTRSTSLVTPFG